MGKHKDSLPEGKNSSRGVSVSNRYPSGRQNSHTPGGRYGYRLKNRIVRANERQERRNSISDEEQLKRLDVRVGPDGAKRERARLKTRIKAAKNPAPKQQEKKEKQVDPKNLKGKQKKQAQQSVK